MPTVNTTAGNIFYTHKTIGGFPPLILIHGAVSNHLGWPGELRLLPPLQVITLDLLGHGKSDPIGCSHVADYAHSVLALLDKLEITQGIMVGHSMGGAIAQTLAVQAPERVAGLVLIGTGSQLPVTSKILDEIHSDFAKVAERITRWEWAEGVDKNLRELSKQHILAISPDVAYGDFMACSQFHLADETLRQIQIPALIIGSNTDKMMAWSASENLAAHLPHATLIQLEGAGHMMHLERPVEVIQHITTWLIQHQFIEETTP
jgi:pimeloyl-ACP methyl ester carboxylesterase